MKNELPAYLQRAVKDLQAAEPGLRLVEWQPYRRSPFRYALRFESDVARTDEELADLEHRVSDLLYEKLGQRRILVYTEVAPAPAAASA
jgi:hypothetical protein